MEKIKNKQKQETYGGVGEMAGWILLAGGALLVSTIANLFKTDKTTYTTKNPNGTVTTTTTYKANKSNAYLRISPIPGKSGVMMGL
jgi:hypothetical protein